MKTTAPIKEFAVGIYDGPHATPKPSDNGPVFLGIKNVTEDGRLDFSEIRHVSEEEFPKWTQRVKPQRDDIVFSYEATLHRYARIPDGFEGCLGRRMALIRPDVKKVDPRFLHYYLLSPIWRAKMESITISGATVNRLPLTSLPNTLVSLPGLNQQSKMANILAAYDELIDNNRRRIALLEEAARILYREWFIHFRFPGHKGVRIIDGLPEGWKRRMLGDVAEVQLGKMLDAKKNRGELRPYLANVNVRWGSFNLSELRHMRFEDHELEKFGLAFGDIVMCEGGEPGRCALWQSHASGMMIQKALHRIRPLAGIDGLFLYHQLKAMAKSRRLEGLFTGSTIKHLPREKLLKALIIVPSMRTISEFASLAGPLEGQKRVLEGANLRASDARDLLLPRLMNGEIAV
jgi:type I restriction enzyme S subunit